MELPECGMEQLFKTAEKTHNVNRPKADLDIYMSYNGISTRESLKVVILEKYLKNLLSAMVPFLGRKEATEW